MPFNRATFDEALVSVFHQACRNVEKDGTAHAVIHAFDKRGAVTAMVLEVATANPVADDDEAATYAAKGITMMQGPFRDRLDDLANLFTNTGAVAAIYVSEAWQATFDPHTDLSPAQRADRQEVLIVQGAWPQQVYERALIARIVRDANGRPSTRPFPDDMAERHTIGWLAECLPDIHGRRPTPT